MKSYIVWTLLFLLGMIIGASAGLWYNGQRAAPVTPVPEPGQVAQLPEAVPPAAQGTTPSPPANLKGPFHYAFTPEELLLYRIDTAIAGQGQDAGIASDVYLNFVGDYSLFTKNVDASGTADLRLLFEDVSLQGNFMESPFEMGFNQNRAYFYDGRTTMDTQTDPSVQQIPQLAFFKEPISMRVAPTGEVLSLSGSQGISGMLTSIPAFTRLEFPDKELEQGAQWESRIQMPIPGFGSGVDTVIRNTLAGYQYVGAHYCAVIVQDFGGSQSGGVLDSPASPMGEAMQFSMPLFDLRGRNTIYFDVATSKMVHTVIDLDLILNIGSALGNVAGVFQELSKALQDGGLSETPAPGGQDAAQQNLLDLALGIDGAITLIEPGQEVLAPRVNGMGP
ncbi:MAG: hypothetical protein IT364_25420 [Candidatus Hydrogenedentes bacterium]|nr:hypothetical protein [Candidatus Hydrogenedentota bacterium]